MTNYKRILLFALFALPIIFVGAASFRADKIETYKSAMGKSELDKKPVVVIIGGDW